MGPEEQMLLFVERMYASRVAQIGDLRGCTAAEIAILGEKYGVGLPTSYTLFLSKMGHAAGKLGNLGEFDLSYEDALRLTEGEIQMWDRCRRKYPDYFAPEFPRHGLVFCARLGNPDYWLLICDGQEDSPIFHFDYERSPVQFEIVHESLFDFLEELRRDAEHWINQGLM